MVLNKEQAKKAIELLKLLCKDESLNNKQIDSFFDNNRNEAITICKELEKRNFLKAIWLDGDKIAKISSDEKTCNATKILSKEIPMTFLQKLIDFSLNGVWLWLERIGFVLTILLAGAAFRQCSIDSKNQKLKQQQEMKPSQIDSKIDSKDTINVSKNDSLIKKLNEK